jgi:hypothetical protein
MHAYAVAELRHSEPGLPRVTRSGVFGTTAKETACAVVAGSNRRMLAIPAAAAAVK